MKNECNIVKELLPNYIENLLSEEVKRYVEKHLESCNNCKQTLEMIRDERRETNNNKKRDEQVELNHLKKYKRKMSTIKILLFIFLLLTLIICTSFIVKFYNVNSVINNANNKKQELAQIENYKVYTTLHHIDYKTQKQYITYDEYYYKDGKYKKISNSYGINFSIQGKTSSSNYGDIHNDEKNKTYISTLFEPYSLYFQDFGFFDNIKVRVGLVLDKTVREDKFNGTDCYVFRAETDDYYREIWIDKYSLIPIKEVQDIYGEMYDEKIISFFIGEVEDEDILIK